MAERRAILIFEYLLACPGAWREASVSMQREATSMLMSLVSDFSRLPDVRPVVLVATEAQELLESSARWPTEIDIVLLENDPAEWLESPQRDPESFAATMVIAPECGGLLVTLLRQLQTGRWKTVPSLNVDWQLAEIFTDKFRTCEWLQQRGFPTPATKAISVAAYVRLKGNRDCACLFADGQSMPTEPGLGILKPRDGVGCDEVSFIQLSADEFSAMTESLAEERPWVLQPYVPGVPCSIGFIGGGGAGSATVLPPAQQNLRLQNGQPVYCGGRIPCEAVLRDAITPVAEMLAVALGDFSGYVGVDLVVGKNIFGEIVATVIEINPRLCTSYVGYRRSTVSNLAGWILGDHRDLRICWNSDVTEFSATGPLRSPV